MPNTVTARIVTMWIGVPSRAALTTDMGYRAITKARNVELRGMADATRMDD